MNQDSPQNYPHTAHVTKQCWSNKTGPLDYRMQLEEREDKVAEGGNGNHLSNPMHPLQKHKQNIKLL